MKLDSYSIDVYDEDVDKKHEHSLLNGESISLEKFLITYDISAIPIVEFSINCYDTQSFSKLKNIYVKTVIKNNVTKEYNIGVVDFLYKPPNNITLYGFLGKYEDLAIESSYLGNSFIACVNSLNFRKNININGKEGFDKRFSDDFPLNYWRIQENKLQCIDKLLRLAHKDSVYSMSNDTIFINTIDYSDSNYNYSTIIPEKTLYISKGNNINWHLNSGDTKSVINHNDEKSTFSLNTSMGKFYLNRFLDTGMINYTSSIPYIKYAGDTLIKLLYKDYPGDFVIGNSMKKINSIVQTASNWFVIQKIEKYSENRGAEMSILFSAKGDETK